MKTQKNKASYTVGWDIGTNIKSQGVDLDVELLTDGLEDALAGKKSLLTEEERRNTMQELSEELQKRQSEISRESAGKNKTEGEEFLKMNLSKEGVKTTASGLQYKVIKKGTGAAPTKNDTVTVNYSGTLIDGTEFDSSYKRGQPATFPVGGVIRGWTEALQLMKAGAKYELFIPSELGYGERGSGRTIGPNAVLIFTVELISVDKKK
ncbi:FKBP-type peptidyl-prolyl cis-trans isomerase [bacterium]|nr:FKBP-type peptidyl-prolyl cis-trans isomerase [bacterium]